MRLLQDCVNAKRARPQCYMNGPYFLLRGTKTARDKILSPLCLHIANVTTMAGHKPRRGPDLGWIRAPLQLRVAVGAILTTINEKIAKEISAESQELPKRSMAPSMRLRSFTGRWSWAARVVPCTRWTVDTLYAVLRVHTEDFASGAESQRRSQRTDKRPKDFPIPTMRGQLALLGTARSRNTMGTVSYCVGPREVTAAAEALAFDASPWGLGGRPLRSAGEVLEYLTSPRHRGGRRRGPRSRGGDAAAQTTLEALAILVGLRPWETRFRGRQL